MTVLSASVARLIYTFGFHVQHSRTVPASKQPIEPPRRNLTVRILAIAAAAIALSGCASTNTVLRLGLNADVTDYVYGCDRKVDFACGRPGPRETVLLEVMYAPGMRFDRTVTPYAGWLHQSGLTAGRPFNTDTREQVIDSVGGGGFIQFRDRH